MSTRTELAEAADALPFVPKGHPYFVQSTKPGTVWVRLERTDYPNPFGGVTFWNVVMVLPQGQEAAEKFLEEHQAPLVKALEPHLVITSVVPQRVDIPGAGILPCAFFNGHRESD